MGIFDPLDLPEAQLFGAAQHLVVTAPGLDQKTGFAMAAVVFYQGGQRLCASVSDDMKNLRIKFNLNAMGKLQIRKALGGLYGKVPDAHKTTDGEQIAF